MNNRIGYYIKVFDLCKNKNVVIVGYGAVGKRVHEQAVVRGDINVLAVCDNASDMASKEYSQEVIKPEEAVKRYKDASYIVTVKKFWHDIYLQLIRLGVPGENIVCINDTYLYECMKTIPDKEYKEITYSKYRGIFNENPDILNPKTYNDFVIKEMLEEPTELKKCLVDKYRVREWIKNKIGEKYLVGLYGVWDKVEDIDFDNLPERCVLKVNCGCGWNIIIQDKSKIDLDVTKLKLKDWVETDFSYLSLELQYRNIPPKIICEEFLSNNENGLNDYKVFCFNGIPYYIMYLTDRQSDLKMAFFDLEWNKMEFVYTYERYEEPVDKPDCLTEMIECSKKLSKGFKQVRIDWYVLDDGTLKFGEMTFSSCAGMAQWKPAEWNRKLGDLICQKK